MAIDFQPLDSGSKIDFQPIDQASTPSSDYGDMASKAIGYAQKAVPYVAAFASGNPMEGVSQYAAPKIADAASQAANYLGGQVAEKGGQAFPNIPAAIPAAAGMATSIAANPLNYVGLGETGFKGGPSELPAATAASREARTGVNARDFQRLYKDPGSFFAKGDTNQAGKAIGDAKTAAGIDLGVNNNVTSLTPDNIDRINPSKSMKMDDINNVLGKITSGQPPTPQEAQNALDSVNSILSQPSVQNNRDVFRQWSAIKTHINNSLGEVAPDVKAANQDFARLKLRDTFASSDAVNKNGKTSKLGMMAKGGSAAMGALLGSFAPGGHPFMGAEAGYALGRTANQIYHSPYAAGLQTAIQSYLDQNAGSGLANVENAGAVPSASAIAAYLQNRNQNQGNGN